MKSIVAQLAMYSCYHRNKRNIVTHLIGVPFIVVALLALLSRLGWVVGDYFISIAVLVALVAALYYLALDVALGCLMAVLLTCAVWGAKSIAASSTNAWLLISISLFVVGWAFQFIGHAYEGRKPAFVDDIMGLAIGPLFVVAEIVFLLGLRKSLYVAVENEVAQLLPQMPTHAKSEN